MESLLLQTSNKKQYLAYQTAAIPMTLSDLQGHSSTASVPKCDFSCSCVAVDMISTDIVRRAVPVR